MARWNIRPRKIRRYIYLCGVQAAIWIVFPLQLIWLLDRAATRTKHMVLRWGARVAPCCADAGWLVNRANPALELRLDKRTLVTERVTSELNLWIQSKTSYEILRIRSRGFTTVVRSKIRPPCAVIFWSRCPWIQTANLLCFPHANAATSSASCCDSRFRTLPNLVRTETLIRPQSNPTTDRV